MKNLLPSALCAALFFAPPSQPEAAAQTTPPSEAKAAKKPTSSSKWRFSILPTSFQRNPLLDFTFVTELTDAGRKLPPPSFEHPVYYLSTSAGHHVEGQNYGDEKPMQIEQLQEKLTVALASNGYRPSDAEHPPTQILRLIWGSHNTISTLDDIQAGANDEDTVASTTLNLGSGYRINSENFKNILSRAKIVGGNKFAREMEVAIADQSKFAGMGSDTGPFNRFMNRDDLTAMLVSQVFDDCYYLIVQSFDAAAYARRGERVLLWQTNMTTPAQGVSLEQTMPGLIDNGAYFLGRETKVPEIVTKRPIKEGKVEIGEAVVKEYISTPSGTAPPPSISGTQNGSQDP